MDEQQYQRVDSLLPESVLFDVDFSLAMHNRTGKYFIGRDLLDVARDLLGQVYYYRLARAAPPSGLWAKIVCKIQGLHTQFNGRGGTLGCQFRPTHPRPILHLEPYTVLSRQLQRHDAVVVHDIGPVTHPHLFERGLKPAYQRIFADIASIGPHLIFVSLASQREFERVYPDCLPASSHVLYPAIRTDIAKRQKCAVAGVGSRFLLTTGSLGDRKNQARAIAAFGQTNLAGLGFQYVLCGPREPGFEEVAEIAARTPGVVLLSYVADEDLAWLYDQAIGFVLPSLLEGFGIPLAEAIEHGTVPLVTADTVLEEVAGEGALTCNALSTQSIANGMVRLVELSEVEREQRLVLLRSAIMRFTIDRFCAEWRLAVVGMTAHNANVAPVRD